MYDAYLTGTVRNPVLRLSFPRSARTPEGGGVMEWVKALPSRRWDPATKDWFVTGTGGDPAVVMQRGGFTIYLDEDADPELGQVDLADLVTPMCAASQENPALAFVRHRFAGYDKTLAIIGIGAIWDKKTGRFEVPVADLVDGDGQPKPGLIMDERTIAAARAARGATAFHVPGAELLARAVSMDAVDTAVVDAVVAASGAIPEWFGLDLFPFQQAGAIAAAAGHGLIADEPGLGKTRQALAAHAIRGTRRLLVTSPPVAISHWKREAAASNVARPAGTTGDEHAVAIIAGRKVPPLPEEGVVVASDSLLNSRPALRRELSAWAQGMVVDESHRHKNIESGRSRAIVASANCTAGLRTPVSGTPMLNSVVELINQLEISGHLQPVFGGRAQFLTDYCRRDRFGNWHTRKGVQKKLREMLREHVMVRRLKHDVLKDLPPKFRQPMLVDIDTKAFREAYAGVTEKIRLWLTEYVEAEQHTPDGTAIKEWCRSNIALLSQMRLASGMVKVDAAVEVVEEFLAANPPNADGLYDRPLAVWAHHQEVIAALKERLGETVIGVLDASNTMTERDRVVDAFQAGQIPVVLCSIYAAGTGITLTRCTDALFVETDWVPGIVMQAEDRHHRIQTVSVVTYTTMVGVGTLDERQQWVLSNKAKSLDTVMGGEHDVAVIEAPPGEAMTEPSDVLYRLVYEELQRSDWRQWRAAA